WRGPDLGIAVRLFRAACGPLEYGPAPKACPIRRALGNAVRSEEHTSELQSRSDLVCRLLLEKKKKGAIRRLRRAGIMSMAEPPVKVCTRPLVQVLPSVPPSPEVRTAACHPFSTSFSSAPSSL